MKPMGRIEMASGWLAGWMLGVAARAAHKRGDHHELAHILAAITAGDSSAASHVDGCWARKVLTPPIEEPVVSKAREGWATLIDMRTGEPVSQRVPVVFETDNGVWKTTRGTNFSGLSIASDVMPYVVVRIELADGQTVTAPMGPGM